ncbi:MAG: asparagine synthase (glutamine-hydrolyzing) [Bosea sp.]|uniref:asparagine synthase (glutamine-hydrolyzing) n=1 Tax=Bosea sp. (in: a-proteobacteria) TaxID=1871050 RepID=UPI001AD1B015|nr:asparagine synthase (glutamine-hydrolyzing) [Bosea sp. (in: a-proteobacteria)]MBN9471553.1 asparagine synthase (glutamine-hydrolyzing) [Bosea sp. (in: a-proteobacteria)]
MCGVSGLVWRDPSRPAGLAEVEAMNAAIFHRGPDDGGVHVHGTATLGHRRLSIIDLSEGGHQPMISQDGALAIVFNGEIYNYIELREELKAHGRRFLTASDTEVLLQAFEQWGPDCLHKLNGMWAFVVFDQRTKRLFAARDRFGIKPLHYVFDERRFAFASEAKALLAAFPDLRRADHAMLAHFLPSGAVDDGPETFFKNVFQLEPGRSLTLDVSRWSMSIDRYWHVDPAAFADRWVQGDPVERMRELLDSAVALHMRADVPVGTCLSGGIDSSTLVGLMSRLHPEPIRAFSGLYKGKEYDEEEFVQAVRDHTGCQGYDIRRTPNGDLLDDLATITWHQDMPTAGPGLYTQFNVMEMASRHVKVILDGQGADELFAGYLPYYALRVNDLLASGRKASAAALVLQVMRHHGGAWIAGVQGSSLLDTGRRAWRKFQARRAAASGAALAPSEPPFFHPSLTERVGTARIERQLESHYPDSLSNALCNHVLTQSIPALLHYEDRNSMAYSIEARVPLLDYRIVEFALGLGAEWKIRDSWTKWVLRKAAEPILPAKVAWRRSKMGYPTPAARWIREGRDKDAAHELLFSQRFLERGIVSRDSVQYYWDQHQSGAVDRSWLLYRYITVELWHRHYVDAFLPRTARPAPEPIRRTLEHSSRQAA